MRATFPPSLYLFYFIQLMLFSETEAPYLSGSIYFVSIMYSYYP
jgi:hypothetical protein